MTAPVSFTRTTLTDNDTLDAAGFNAQSAVSATVRDAAAGQSGVMPDTTTAAGLAMVIAANAAAQRTLLGLGTADTPSFAGAALNGSMVGTEILLAKTSLAAGNTVSRLWHAATSGDNYFAEFGTEATFTARGSITYNRAGGLTAFNVSSDRRAKDIFGELANSGSLIDAITVYDAQMKGATARRPMFIADELEQVLPFAVTGKAGAEDEAGNPILQQVAESSLVPLLTAEIKALRARVAHLEAA